MKTENIKFNCITSKICNNTPVEITLLYNYVTSSLKFVCLPHLYVIDTSNESDIKDIRGTLRLNVFMSLSI